MSDLVVAAIFTKNTGQPATGLVLAEIDFYLTAIDRVTGLDTVIWDGTQNPTDESANVGAYTRVLTTADLDAYNYIVQANYTGVTVLDQDWVSGGIGIEELPIGTAEERTYTVYKPDEVTPIEGVRIEIRIVASLSADIYWSGESDAFGVARDDFGNKPRLDAGTWYYYRTRGGYTFSNPDTEVYV